MGAVRCKMGSIAQKQQKDQIQDEIKIVECELKIACLGCKTNEQNK